MQKSGWLPLWALFGSGTRVSEQAGLPNSGMCAMQEQRRHHELQQLLQRMRFSPDLGDAAAAAAAAPSAAAAVASKRELEAALAELRAVAEAGSRDQPQQRQEEQQRSTTSSALRAASPAGAAGGAGVLDSYLSQGGEVKGGDGAEGMASDEDEGEVMAKLTAEYARIREQLEADSVDLGCKQQGLGMRESSTANTAHGAASTSSSVGLLADSLHGRGGGRLSSEAVPGQQRSTVSTSSITGGRGGSSGSKGSLSSSTDLSAEVEALLAEAEAEAKREEQLMQKLIQEAGLELDLGSLSGSAAGTAAATALDGGRGRRRGVAIQQEEVMGTRSSGDRGGDGRGRQALRPTKPAAKPAAPVGLASGTSRAERGGKGSHVREQGSTGGGAGAPFGVAGALGRRLEPVPEDASLRSNSRGGAAATATAASASPASSVAGSSQSSSSSGGGSSRGSSAGSSKKGREQQRSNATTRDAAVTGAVGGTGYSSRQVGVQPRAGVGGGLPRRRGGGEGAVAAVVAGGSASNGNSSSSSGRLPRSTTSSPHTATTTSSSSLLTAESNPMGEVTTGSEFSRGSAGGAAGAGGWGRGSRGTGRGPALYEPVLLTTRPPGKEPCI